MLYIFQISLDQPALAKEEIKRLLCAKIVHSEKEILIADTDKQCIDRLSYTNKAFSLLFTCSTERIQSKMDWFDWQGIYEKDFSVRRYLLSEQKAPGERELAAMVWHRLDKPKAKLRDATTQIEFFIGKKTHCGRLIWENNKEFLLRKAHLRPALHPSSMSPRLARACVNLTGLISGNVLDPFCGSGGILIEAAMMGFEVSGFDIDAKMIERARVNLDHYGIKRYRLKAMNAADITGHWDAIVTDLPYGRNTIASNRNHMAQFFRKAYDCTDRAVVMISSKMTLKGMTWKWKVSKKFSYYLHKSLSKTILLLEK